MFLQHFSSGRYSVIRPGFWRLGTAACSVVVSIASSILIVRTLGPADFGIYLFVLWLAKVEVPAVGVGMSTVTSRRIGEVQAREDPRLGAVVFHSGGQQQ